MCSVCCWQLMLLRRRWRRLRLLIDACPKCASDLSVMTIQPYCDGVSGLSATCQVFSLSSLTPRPPPSSCYVVAVVLLRSDYSPPLESCCPEIEVSPS
ncbi:unnamed protein product [Schistocephalus solidus]|uniref:Uncharacterized protein n=1 Tax=Schistocephalus solidus TaxID=70667 RepID=A0A3P7E3G1_SCHSO|nr:unnamed protein product [Schistocephalus solidus]